MTPNSWGLWFVLLKRNPLLSEDWKEVVKCLVSLSSYLMKVQRQSDFPEYRYCNRAGPAQPLVNQRLVSLFGFAGFFSNISSVISSFQFSEFFLLDAGLPELIPVVYFLSFFFFPLSFLPFCPHIFGGFLKYVHIPSIKF